MLAVIKVLFNLTVPESPAACLIQPILILTPEPLFQEYSKWQALTNVGGLLGELLGQSPALRPIYPTWML